MLVLGRIIAPFGVQGWIKLIAAWRIATIRRHGETMPAWWLGRDPDGTEWRRYELEALKAHGKGLVAKLRGIDDRTAAEAIDGSYIAAPREALAAAAEWRVLLGRSDRPGSGECAGREARHGGRTDRNRRQRCAGGARREDKQCASVCCRSSRRWYQEVDVPSRVIRVDWEADW